MLWGDQMDDESIQLESTRSYTTKWTVLRARDIKRTTTSGQHWGEIARQYINTLKYYNYGRIKLEIWIQIIDNDVTEVNVAVVLVTRRRWRKVNLKIHEDFLVTNKYIQNFAENYRISGWLIRVFSILNVIWCDGYFLHLLSPIEILECLVKYEYLMSLKYECSWARQFRELCTPWNES